MSNHQKRLSVPNSWPVERKTQTFTVKADAGPHGEDGVPLLIVLRDVLGYVDSRKEARYALGQDQILINGAPESDESRPVGMFDILAFTEREEYYRVFPGEGGRLALTAIDAEAAESKLGKIVGKQHVPGGDVQLTLHDGHTLLVEDASEYTPGDSIVIGNEDSEASGDASDASGDGPRAGEIVAHFEYEEGALVTAVDGQHAGEIGEIEEIQVTAGSSPNNVLVAQEGGDGFETIDEYVVVIDENFTGDEEDKQAAPEADAGAETPDEADDADADSDEQTDDEDEGGDDE
ncbi:Ribosomal protein S4E [Halapricum desulfuricans]|uniref:Small ribosomal subunit protein eS4 n=1 Tax=Halapricum desulfuricans TaxID=2841257 RepID=A0A897NI08_9EURY|nr:30S ribosomal protein S4e [Halapricum desulfuricans]QSG12367.1 Ribosomal protein S4E [Halapricum desulfuricans]